MAVPVSWESQGIDEIYSQVLGTEQVLEAGKAPSCCACLPFPRPDTFCSTHPSSPNPCLGLASLVPLASLSSCSLGSLLDLPLNSRRASSGHRESSSSPPRS